MICHQLGFYRLYIGFMMEVFHCSPSLSSVTVAMPLGISKSVLTRPNSSSTIYNQLTGEVVLDNAHNSLNRVCLCSLFLTQVSNWWRFSEEPLNPSADLHCCHFLTDCLAISTTFFFIWSAYRRFPFVVDFAVEMSKSIFCFSFE